MMSTAKPPQRLPESDKFDIACPAPLLPRRRATVRHDCRSSSGATVSDGSIGRISALALAGITTEPSLLQCPLSGGVGLASSCHDKRRGRPMRARGRPATKVAVVGRRESGQSAIRCVPRRLQRTTATRTANGLSEQLARSSVGVVRR